MAANLAASAVNAVFTLTVKTVYDQKTINDLLSAAATAGSPAGGAPDSWNYAEELSDFFGKLAGGAFSANIVYMDAGATGQATDTLTFTGNPANNDTITLQGVTITLVTGTPAGSQVKIGASQAATMTNIITFINAGGNAANIAGVCTAAQTSTNVITLTAIPPGIVGNTITLAKSSTAISVGGATFSGGVALSQSGPVSIGI